MRIWPLSLRLSCYQPDKKGQEKEDVEEEHLVCFYYYTASSLSTTPLFLSEIFFDDGGRKPTRKRNSIREEPSSREKRLCREKKKAVLFLFSDVAFFLLALKALGNICMQTNLAAVLEAKRRRLLPYIQKLGSKRELWKRSGATKQWPTHKRREKIGGAAIGNSFSPRRKRK